MNITATQMKLARTLLDWTQEQLGQKVGLSKSSIVKIESGKSFPKKHDYDVIVSTFRENGVEFLEGNGVRERQAIISRYHDIEGFKQFMDDVYNSAFEYGGDICLYNSKPSLWIKYLGQDWYDKHNERMAQLGDRVRIRITVAQDESNFILDIAEHRWLLKDKWQSKVFYAYGPKLGFVDFSGGTVHITVFEEKEFAESFKIMFDAVWDHETKPTEIEK